MRSIPTLILFSAGEPAARSVGAKPGSILERDLGFERFAGPGDAGTGEDAQVTGGSLRRWWGAQ